MKKNVIGSLILLSATLLYLVLVINQNKSIFLKKFNYSQQKKLYDESQWQQSQNFSEDVELEKWAISKGYTGWNNYMDEEKNKANIPQTRKNIISSIQKKGISDAQLYAYAGYEYVHGKDPTLLNPEHPPLGKYLIGLSIFFFQNEHIVLIITGVVSLLLLFLLVYTATSSLAASSLAVFLTATHSLFVDQLIHGPQLDIFQLMFFLLLTIFMYRFDKKKQLVFLALAGISFGLLISIKTFFSYYLLFGAWLFLYLFLRKGRLIQVVKDTIIIHVLGLAVFCTTYASYFLQGGTIKKFLGVQKYIFMFYRQSGIDPVPFLGNYLRLIFTGSWKFWSKGSPLTHYDQWNILWIFIFIAGLFVCYKYLRSSHSRHNPLILLLIVFSILYNAFLFIFPIFPRYLLLLFVPYHIFISLYFLKPIK